MMAAQSSSIKREQLAPAPLQISSLAGYQRFGEYLRVKRHQFGLTQDEMGTMFSTLSGQTYGYLERERRAPQVEELVPLFAALVELHADLRLPPMQGIEAQTFFRLGKAAIERKQRKRQAVSREQWNDIEQQLLAMVSSNPQHSSLRLVALHGASPIVEASDSRRRKALDNALNTDVSSLLERDHWVRKAISQLHRTPPIKVSVYQGGMGAGKSHALALLIKQLTVQEDLFLIPYKFEQSNTMTCEDHLDVFLATLYADLTMQAADETKQRSLEERIKQTLGALYAFEKPVVLLLDDAQEIFPSASEWSPAWHQFFRTFITEPHTTTMYLMTRTWPGWDERNRSFLYEDNVPDLSSEAAMLIWKRLGFDDVEDTLLRAVCKRCGANPQMIEMLAFQYKRRSFSVALGKDAVLSSAENPNTRALKKLLTSDTLFSNYLDGTSRRTLQQIFSNRFSGETRRVLEWLAVSSLGIPFNVLMDRFDYAADAYEDLIKASFADLTLAASQRAALVPLVREAALQSFTTQRKNEVEQEVLQLYTFWLQEMQEFRDEKEQAALIAEIVIQYMKQRQLLKAAEVLVEHGWLSFAFGHAPRLVRIAKSILDQPDQRQHLENEVGWMLLQCRLFHFVESISADERRAIYLKLYDLMHNDQLTFKPTTSLYVIHHKLRYIINEEEPSEGDVYEKAWLLINEECERLSKLDLITFAELLDEKAYVAGRRGDFLEFSVPEEASFFWNECAKIHRQCLELLEQSERYVHPLQRSRILFKKARLLHDLGYYERRLGNIQKAEKALEQCLLIKEAGYSTPRSRAISYDDHAYLLALSGQYQNALRISEKAISIVQGLVDGGRKAAKKELGMLHINRGRLLLLLGRFNEAQEYYKSGTLLVKDSRDKSRRLKTIEAEQGLAVIYQQKRENPRGLLDKRWTARYQPLVDYSDVGLLIPAGPLTDDERVTWKRLSSLYDEASQSAIQELVARSCERELEASILEQREPHLLYLYAQQKLDDLSRKIASLNHLKEEIEVNEQNVIVQRLYSCAIEERINELSLIIAAGEQNTEVYAQRNRELNSIPSIDEAIIALRPLASLLRLGLQRQDTQALCQQIMNKAVHWHIDLLSDVESEDGTRDVSTNPSDSLTFTSETIERFFYEVFKQYQFSNWTIVRNSATDHARVSYNREQLILPNKAMSLAKIRELLAHEIEIHTFRSVAGKRSRFALLATGLDGSLATEEGLAMHYAQEVASQRLEANSAKTWIGTLATSLASGVFCEPLTFSELREFLELMNLLRSLLVAKLSNHANLQEKARRQALNRCLRTFRGVADLSQRGVCSTKDNSYLRGYLAVNQKLVEDEVAFERLMVGTIGIHHLGDMAELGITTPQVKHQQLALDPDLQSHLTFFER